MDSITVFVTGAKGQLGFDTIKELQKRGISYIASDIGPDLFNEFSEYVPLDITKSDAVLSCLERYHPSAVIHCAAWTAVDAAEEENNRNKVYEVNVKGTENLACACNKIHAKLLYISTDYVFSGLGELPWKADCTDFSPLNYYGVTKLAGEKAVRNHLDRYYIVRTSWVFGLHGNNFIKTMLRIGANRDSVRVVCDQIGAPTYTEDLASLLVDMIQTDRYGCYHATNSGEFISWYDFCCEIYRLAEMKTVVTPVTTAEYGVSLAKRPFNSRMDLSKLQRCGFSSLPHWKDALERYLSKL